MGSPIRETRRSGDCQTKAAVAEEVLEMLLLVLWSLVATATALYGSGDAVVDLTPANFDKQARNIYPKINCTATTLHFMCCRVGNFPDDEKNLPVEDNRPVPNPIVLHPFSEKRVFL